MTDGTWGITLNGLDLTGSVGPTTFKALDVKGWSGGPGSTGSVVQNLYGDGGWMTEARDSPKTLVIPGTIKAKERPDVRAGFDLLAKYIPRGVLRPLVVNEDGLVRHMWVRLDQAPPDDQWQSDMLAEFAIQLVAPDPRKFSGDGTAAYSYSASTGLPASEGGLQMPASLPFSIGATMVSGSVVITNRGDARPPVVVRFTNVVNPSVIDANGKRMDFGITVGSGQTLEVDLDAKTVKLNGVNRRNTMSGQWLVPADGTELKFNATAPNTNARMTVRWSDAWR